jgi:hypothetical protein
MRAITARNLILQFDTGQITDGDDRAQVDRELAASMLAASSPQSFSYSSDNIEPDTSSFILYSFRKASHRLSRGSSGKSS